MRFWLSLNSICRGAAFAAGRSSGGGAGEGLPRAPRVDQPVCHVGLVFALGIESAGLVDMLSGVVRTQGHGFVAREGGLDGRRLVIFESTPGLEAAARATRALIAGHRPRFVISAGFAGGLDAELSQGDFVVADEVVGEKGEPVAIQQSIDPAAISAHARGGRLLSVDRVIGDPAEKLALHERSGAVAVDMETLAVARECAREQVPFLSARIIIDAADRQLPADIDHLLKQRSVAGKIGAVAGAVWRRPGSVKDLWRLKEDALAGSDRLAKFLARVAPLLDRTSRPGGH